MDIAVATERAEVIVKASTVLHNFVREQYSEMESTSSDPDARELTSVDAALQSLERRSGREAMKAMAVRSAFMRYFSSTEGSLPWQEERIERIS